MQAKDPFETPGNFSEDVGLFEAATHCTVIQFPEPVVKTICLALDGSDRDDTVRGFGELLASRTGAQIATLEGKSTAGEILAALAEKRGDLLIFPAPFGKDYQELKAESLGAVADQLLLKAACPVLCVRGVQDQSSIRDAFQHVVVPIAVADEHAPRALGWAFRTTPSGGHVDLAAVADRDVLTEAGHLIPDIEKLDPEHVARALIRDMGGLIAASQRRGTAENRKVHVETRVGQFVPLVLAELHGRPRAIIWGISRDHSSPAFHRAVDLLLSSSGPVLMV